MNEWNDKSADDAFAEGAKAHFDESVERLDGETRSRLNRSRHAALAELERGRPAWAKWVPATGVAAAAVMALVIWTGGPQTDDLGLKVLRALGHHIDGDRGATWLLEPTRRS